MRDLPLTLALLAFLVAMTPRLIHAEEPEVRYFADFEEILETTPKGRTEYFSTELGRDFTQWPIPWERQIFNAITDVGGSNTQQDFIGGFEYWVPFDEIPGEENFPMMKRLTLNAQRGYQRSIIHSHVALDEALADYRAENAEILEKYRAESEASLAALVKSSDALLAGSLARRNAVEDEIRLIAEYEAECFSHFPDYSLGCDILAHSLVSGSYGQVPPVSFAPGGESIKRGDVFITTPNGRFLGRLDPNAWVSWFQYDDISSEAPVISPAS